MTFEGQYLTYAEYQALGGSAIGEMPFNLLEYEARKQIDLRTQNRLKDVDGEYIPQEVKLCVNNLINTLLTYVNKKNRNIQSETVGKYSINYGNDVKEIVKSKNSELNDIILTDLYGVIVNNEHILYLGVD